MVVFLYLNFQFHSNTICDFNSLYSLTIRFRVFFKVPELCLIRSFPNKWQKSCKRFKNKNVYILLLSTGSLEIQSISFKLFLYYFSILKANREEELLLDPNIRIHKNVNEKKKKIIISQICSKQINFFYIKHVFNFRYSIKRYALCLILHIFSTYTPWTI